MDPIKNSFFYPPYQQQSAVGLANLAILAILALFVGFSFATINLDPAFDIATLSRALYVDEGFYSDAAQNFVKFGDWGLPFDSRHWPGAPALTVLQTIVFSVFGISITAARLICVFFAALSIFCLYSIARMKLTPMVSVLLSLSAASIFSFFAHSRAAIADPIATGFSLLALFMYVRVSNKNWAIPLSVLFAFLAFCSKMYFLFCLMTVVFLWLTELLVMPIIGKAKFNWRALILLFVSLVAVGLLYLGLRIQFDAAFAQFLHINSNKTPRFDLYIISLQLKNSFMHLPFNTKLHVYLASFLLSLAIGLLLFLRKFRFNKVIEFFSLWGRAGWALTIFVALGLFTVAVLNYPSKAHYQYHAILPLACLSIFALKAVLPARNSNLIIVLVLLINIIFQSQYYYQWFSRGEMSRINDANVKIVSMIEASTNDEQIPVIGQYSAQLAMYSDRMVSLEVRWVSKAELCQRMEYWRPMFFINFFFPKRSNLELNLINQCELLSGAKEIARFSLNPIWEDEIVLYQLSYNE